MNFEELEKTINFLEQIKEEKKEEFFRDIEKNIKKELVDDLTAYYGLDEILNNLQYNQETSDDVKNYNILTTCFLSIGEIIKAEDNKNTIPLF